MEHSNLSFAVTSMLMLILSECEAHHTLIILSKMLMFTLSDASHSRHFFFELLAKQHNLISHFTHSHQHGQV